MSPYNSNNSISPLQQRSRQRQQRQQHIVVVHRPRRNKAGDGGGVQRLFAAGVGGVLIVSIVYIVVTNLLWLVSSSKRKSERNNNMHHNHHRTIPLGSMSKKNHLEGSNNNLLTTMVTRATLNSTTYEKDQQTRSMTYFSSSAVHATAAAKIGNIINYTHNAEIGDNHHHHHGGSSANSPYIIPHILYFSHRTNILRTKRPRHFYENIQNTISAYREAWGHEPEVRYLVDADCERIINETKPKLHFFYRWERYGPYRGDICRTAALYGTGGYWFDADLRVLHPWNADAPNRAQPTVPSPCTFVTVHGPERQFFTQAFIAVSPKHQVLRKALTLMQYQYKQLVVVPGKSNSYQVHQDEHSGPRTLFHSYYGVVRLNRTEPTEHCILDEVNLTAPQMYPSLPRQDGEGCCCNYVMHNRTEERVYFFSRIVGGSRLCKIRSSSQDDGSSIHEYNSSTREERKATDLLDDDENMDDGLLRREAYQKQYGRISTNDQQQRNTDDAEEELRGVSPAVLHPVHDSVKGSNKVGASNEESDDGGASPD